MKPIIKLEDYIPLPQKHEDSNMTDSEWETYCIEVGVCNSLNARAGAALHNKDYEMHDLLTKAQAVITFLLKETGRV